MEHVENAAGRRPLLVLAGLAVALIVGFMALSAAFDKPGDANDPFLAEVGNLGSIVAAAGLLAIGVIAAVRAARGR